MVAGVRDLLPVLRERAQETEDARVVPAESVKALEETGFFRLLQPAAYDGLEADPVTFLSAVRLIASACGSTGWVASVLGVHAWQLALFPPQAAEEVWGADRAARMSSSYAPTGKAHAVPGGHQLTGRWSFSSGCDHARWVLLGGIVTDGEGNPVDFRTFLLPATDYEIDDVWDTVGLRGTGSNDIVVADVFVPEHRSLSFTDVSRCACPGHEVNKAPLYRLPYGSLFSYAITMPIIGMATGAYDAHVAYQRDRVRASYVGQKAAEDPHGQVRVARAAADLDCGLAGRQPQHGRADGVRPGGAEDPAAAAAAGPPRPGARHRPGDRRGGPAVRELRRAGPEDRHPDPAVLAGRARGPGARHQRPGAGAVGVRPRAVRPGRAARRHGVTRPSGGCWNGAPR